MGEPTEMASGMDKPGEMAVFVRVVEEGGFSAAARALALTPSAVSKLIGRLEARLRVRLMHRTTRTFSLTHEGVAFYQRAARILREIEEAEEAVSRVNAAPRGALRVSAAVAFATYQLVPLLPEFFERYPEVHLELSVTDRVIDLVEDGVDVALRIGARIDSSLISRRLADDHRIICATPGYLQRRGTPQQPSDLMQHDCLAWIGNQGGEALYQTIAAGLGIGRIAEFRVADDIRAGRLLPLLQGQHREDPLPIHAVYPHRRHLLPKVRVFVDYLLGRFTPVPPWRTVFESIGVAPRERER
jgi:DNA-binding transcriptional LysR family regulator